MHDESHNAETGAANRPPGFGRRGGMAIALQEALTVAGRLRSERQAVESAEAFRAHVRRLLATADRQTRNGGYAQADARLAVYAVIAFLDESVLASRAPIFSDWGRRPLQEEIFGEHVAGETFYRYLGELMRRADSEDTADVLEVYVLCLLLGFKGKYAADPGTHHAVIASAQEKLRRIRGTTPLTSPEALPPEETLRLGRDPWQTRLLALNGVLAATCLALLALFSFLLGSSRDDLTLLVARLIR